MTDRLLDWYDSAARDLPWRRTREPYAIWVSEIMCQQTQVGTVIPYYERWMSRFPTAQSLAEASEEDVLAHWQGLGYYRRARMLHQGARAIKDRQWPNSAKEWQEIPGIGPYTAAAIASISHGEAVPVVDGNVDRVVSRVNLLGGTKASRHAPVRRWAAERISPERPGDWNQALMELGAKVCTPRNPDCSNCPLASECKAHQTEQAGHFPPPEPRKETVDVQLFVRVPVRGGRFGVRQFTSGEWWAGLWGFPISEGPESGPSFLQFRHTVTHHRLHIVASLAHEEEGEWRWVSLQELEDLPMPTPMRKIAKAAATLF